MNTTTRSAAVALALAATASGAFTTGAFAADDSIQEVIALESVQTQPTGNEPEPLPAEATAVPTLTAGTEGEVAGDMDVANNEFDRTLLDSSFAPALMEETPTPAPAEADPVPTPEPVEEAPVPTEEASAPAPSQDPVPAPLPPVSPGAPTDSAVLNPPVQNEGKLPPPKTGVSPKAPGNIGVPPSITGVSGEHVAHGVPNMSSPMAPNPMDAPDALAGVRTLTGYETFTPVAPQVGPMSSGVEDIGSAPATLADTGAGLQLLISGAVIAVIGAGVWLTSRLKKKS